MMLDDPMLFSTVMLNVYSEPAMSLETMTDVVFTLLTETSLKLCVKFEAINEYV